MRKSSDKVKVKRTQIVLASAQWSKRGLGKGYGRIARNHPDR